MPAGSPRASRPPVRPPESLPRSASSWSSCPAPRSSTPPASSTPEFLRKAPRWVTTGSISIPATESDTGSRRRPARRTAGTGRRKKLRRGRSDCRVSQRRPPCPRMHRAAGRKPGSRTRIVRRPETQPQSPRSDEGARWVPNISSSVEAEESQSEYYYAKNDAVPHEHGQRPLAQVVHQQADDQHSGDRAGDHSDQKRGVHLGRNAAAVPHQIPQFFRCCSGGDRSQQQERKSRRGLAVEVAEQSGRDGGPASGNSRNHSQSLRRPDGDRIPAGQVAQILLAPPGPVR